MAHLASTTTLTFPGGRHRRPAPAAGRHRRSRRPLSARLGTRLGAVLAPLGAAVVVAFAAAFPTGQDL